MNQKILFPFVAFLCLQNAYGANIDFSSNGATNTASSFITISSQTLLLEEGKQGVDTSANTISFIDTATNTWKEGLGSFSELKILAPHSEIYIGETNGVGAKVGKGLSGIEITAKSLSIGNSKAQSLINPLQGFLNGSFQQELSALSLTPSKTQAQKISSNVSIEKNGLLEISSNVASLQIEGDLSVIEGGVFFHSPYPSLLALFSLKNLSKISVSGDVSLSNAKLGGYIPSNGEIGDLQLIEAGGKMLLDSKSGFEEIYVYGLKDFVALPQNSADYDKAYYTNKGFFKYTLGVVNNTLIASPSLTQETRDKDIITLVRTSAKDIATNLALQVSGNLKQKLENYANNGDSSGLYGFEKIEERLGVISSPLLSNLANSIKNSSNEFMGMNYLQSFFNLNSTLSTRLPLEARDSISQELWHSRNNSLSQGVDLAIQTMLSDRFFADKTQRSNLWANTFFGGNVFGSEVGGLFGVMLGYDALALDDLLLGTFISYGYSYFDDVYLSSSSHQLYGGMYLKKILEQSNEIEWDLGIGANFENHTIQTQELKSQTQTSYISPLLKINFSYGYRFDVNSWGIKPLMSVLMSYGYTPTHQEEGDIQREILGFHSFKIALKAGLDIQHYFSESGKVFFKTLIGQEAFQLNQDVDIKINGEKTPLDSNLAEQTYLEMIVGVKGSLSEDLRIFGNIGVKQGIYGVETLQNDWKNQTFFTGNVGIEYLF